MGKNLTNQVGAGAQREKLGSRLGFLLLSAGCAIGIGNVWKFPYITGQNGGGMFVLIYILFLVILGVPVLTMEFTLGRASQKSPMMLYQQLQKPGQKWHVHGYASFAGSYLLMMFYTVITGMMLLYLKSTVFGDLQGLTPDAVTQFNGDLKLNYVAIGIATAVVIVLGFLVCGFGVQKGLERVTKIMMIALLFLMIGIAIYCCCQKGALEGLKFYLVPNLDAMKEVGVGNVIVAAMNQAFFTLSLGIGSMAIFGSYIGKDRALMGEAVSVTCLDTVVALTSGLIIFPACFAFNNGNTTAGPDLIFITLPNIFNNMPGGRIIGSLFFVFMFFAAFSTVLGVFEHIIACACERFNWSRTKSCLINGALMLVLCVPCIVGFALPDKTILLGKGIMDWEDFIVSNILLPLGSLTFVLFCTLKAGKGWGWNNFMLEANQGKGLKVKNWMRIYMSYILPVIILALFVVGILQSFGIM